MVEDHSDCSSYYVQAVLDGNSNYGFHSGCPGIRGARLGVVMMVMRGCSGVISASTDLCLILGFVLPS